MNPGTCTSLWKTRQRLSAWFRVQMTATRIKRILEEKTEHASCQQRDTVAVKLEDFNTFINNKRCVLVDQTRVLSWSLVSNVDTFLFMTLDGATVSEVLELAMDRLLEHAIEVILHDQSSSLTLTEWRACKELCQENNMQFQVHGYGLKLNLQRQVERTHTFSR